MAKIKKLHKVTVEKFQEILRSGKDYTVVHMCNEVGKDVNLEGESVRAILNRYYRKNISQEMICFINHSILCRDEEIKQFSEKFQVCPRESILIIRYIRKRKRNE